MSRSLAGKVALVTGASSGIGEAAALMLARAGVSIVVTARREDRLARLANEITALGVGAMAVAGDMSIEDEAVRAVHQTVERFGRIDIAINSAGIMQTGGIEGIDFAAYRRVIDVNFYATLHVCGAAVPYMVAAGGGDIIGISSLAARKQRPESSAYAASKHALNAMLDAMRQELGGRDIRVCALMPGATRTEVASGITDPAWRSAIEAHVAKDGAIDPLEIAETIMFILSLPRRVNVSEIIVRPTIDTTA